jgi:hypothetical protein
MASFRIEWDRCRLQWARRTDLAPWTWQATLTESLWLGGRRQTRVICAVARILEDRIGDVAEQQRFWEAARRKIGRLHRLDHRDRWQIELELRKKVPMPQPSLHFVTLAQNPN